MICRAQRKTEALFTPVAIVARAASTPTIVTTDAMNFWESVRTIDLYGAPVPVDLMLPVDLNPVQTLNADWLNAGRPARRRGVGQDFAAFSTADRRLSISAIASASFDGSVRARAKDAGMSNSAGTSEPGTVRFCYAERDARKEVSIFVTMAPNLAEPSHEVCRLTDGFLFRSGSGMRFTPDARDPSTAGDHVQKHATCALSVELSRARAHGA